ncbi:MAG: uncharacterized protein A8A55_3085, partial [Amphiamblys sp. WSBS2006]
VRSTAADNILLFLSTSENPQDLIEGLHHPDSLHSGHPVERLRKTKKQKVSKLSTKLHTASTCSGDAYYIATNKILLFRKNPDPKHMDPVESLHHQNTVSLPMVDTPWRTPVERLRKTEKNKRSRSCPWICTLEMCIPLPQTRFLCSLEQDASRCFLSPIVPRTTDRRCTARAEHPAPSRETQINILCVLKKWSALAVFFLRPRYTLLGRTANAFAEQSKKQTRRLISSTEASGRLRQIAVDVTGTDCCREEQHGAPRKTELFGLFGRAS